MEGKGGGGGGGGGEVRRLHIVYFLSHMGRVEHPHLIRVHHFTRSGVYLRDVKRWLGDLRGKDMPEAYAWAYKRRYKRGYVWQDLVDDDLITPLSDNEYVLKGSKIISPPTDEKRDSCSYARETKATNSIHKEQHPNKVKSDQTEDQVPPESTTTFSLKESQKKIFPDSKIDPPSKIFSEINEESSSFGSERSSLTDDFDSVKFDQANKNLAAATHHNINNNDSISTPLYNNNFPSTDRKPKNKKKKKKKKKITSEIEVEEMPSSSRLSSSSTKSPLPAKRKSFSGVGGASNVLRNLITCGAVDTNDTVLVMLNRSGGGGQNGDKNKMANNDHLGRSARVFRTCSDHQEEKQQPHRHSTSRRSYDERKGPKNQQTEFTKQRPTPAAYRPVGEPNCSQCGKTFRPEKMHSHMKSCRGMKALGKSNWSNAPTSLEKSRASHSKQGSMNTPYKEPALGYFLTN